jgi:hypothetical protein
MTVHTFTEAFETGTDGAVLTFGHIEVDTDPEYEDEYDEDEETA